MKDIAAVFGDVHGESSLLSRLIEEIYIECGSDIDLYSVGDLIDRGPDSAEVIELCINNNVLGICGNHELWLINLVRNRLFDSFSLSKIMGGAATFESYGVNNFENHSEAALLLLNRMPDSHKKFVTGLLNYRHIEIYSRNYWLLHSGLTKLSAKNFIGLSCQSDVEMMDAINSYKPENYIMWPSTPISNGGINDGMYSFDNGTQIFGHKPLKVPIVRDDFIALDTGCGTCEPFTLSAVLLPSRKIIQVSRE